jgi:hypothetical protein
MRCVPLHPPLLPVLPPLASKLTLGHQNRWACACGHYRFCAKLFADHTWLGPDALDLDASNVPWLHLTVASGSAETVEVLARAGIGVNRRNAQGATAIGLAAQKGLLNIVEVWSSCERVTRELRLN